MKQRNSNIELLRILAMLMIIDVHYFASCSAGANTLTGSGTWVVYHLMESLGICGVNIFVLITGFFSLEQQKIKQRKIADLLIDIAFWGALGYALSMAVGWKTFDLKAIIKTAFPILFGGRWFVKAYIVLLCFIPFMNPVLRSLSRSSYKTLLVILILIFSIWPSFFPNPPLDDYGYGFFHFVVLYVIAGYIRLHVKLYPSKWYCFLGYCLSSLVVILSSFLENNYAWAYNYIFVIIQAVCLLMLFSQLQIQSKTVNTLAACSFGVFLIHTDGFFSKLIYDRLLRCNELVSGSTGLFLLSALASLPIFYLFGFLLESLKKKIFAISIDRCLDKIPILNKTIEIETNAHEN